MNGERKLNKQSLAGSSYTVSPWYSSVSKRVCDLCGAILLLIAFFPLMAVVALAVKLTSPGPVLFRQRRPGKNGSEFQIFKFRTMVAEQRSGPAFTRAADPRITRLGRSMRKWKLDELPQLFNVVRGEMSFVGPRPLPVQHWKQAPVEREAASILSVRPGITSQATVNFRDEEQLLMTVSPDQVEAVYMRQLMPLKLKMDLEYMEGATFASDLRIMFKTGFRVFRPQRQHSESVKKACVPVKEHPGLVATAKQEDCVPSVEQGD